MTSSISVADRRRLLIDRQLLARSASERSGRSIIDVARTLGPLHSTDPVTPYLTIHARSGASVEEIDDALYDERTLVRFTTLRRTVFAMDHAVASASFGVYNADLVRQLRAQLVKWLTAADELDEDPAAFLEHTERAVRTAVRSEPATGSELSRAVPELRTTVNPRPQASYSKPFRITSKVLEVMAAEATITRTRPTGKDLTSGSWRWAACADLNDGTLDAAMVSDAEAALDALLTRYLSAFGPASVTDMTWWTGLTKTKVRAGLDRIGAVDVEVEDAPEPCHSLPGDDLRPSVGDGRPCVALLPGLDSTTMGWKQRSWYVDDTPATGIFDRNGNAGPTVWLDGRVVGVWTQRSDGAIAIEWVEPVASDVDDLVASEAERIRAWLGDVRVKWRYPTPITKRLST